MVCIEVEEERRQDLDIYHFRPVTSTLTPQNQASRFRWALGLLAFEKKTSQTEADGAEICIERPQDVRIIEDFSTFGFRRTNTNSDEYDSIQGVNNT